MKRFFILNTFFLCFLGNLTAQSVIEPPKIKDPKQIINSQLSSLEDLIAMTESTLTTLKELQVQIHQYQEIQELYLEHNQDKDLLYRMLKIAHQINKEIKEKHLVYAFDSEFLAELNMFSQMYNKISLPRPSKL